MLASSFDDLIENPSQLLSTMAAMLASEGNAKGVAILADAESVIRKTGHDDWNGGVDYYTLHVSIPIYVFGQVSQELQTNQTLLLEKVQAIVAAFDEDNQITQVKLAPMLENPPDWRSKAHTMLAGQGINNQGRVRSDNLASRSVDGLLFRSEPEINLYFALKSQGISFAPLPVFVRGGSTYQRIEPDFVIVSGGQMMVIEVDGDTVHTETPADAHSRTTMLQYEGVHIERVHASECRTRAEAQDCAKRMLAVLEKVRASRR